MIAAPTAAQATAVAKPRVRVTAPSRAGAMAMRSSYSGASTVNDNIRLWRPPLKSADAEILRDAGVVRARARDLERNHPYARQAVRASRLGVIGKRLRYSCRPDFRFLGIDQEEAIRWGQEWERIWESYAHPTGASVHLDAGRRMNFTAFMALAHDRDFTDGEHLITAEWDDNRKWKTCFQAIDVDRLSNPNGYPDSARRKGGVELDDLSAPLGYHIRNAHPGDHALLDARASAITWSFVARETPWGRPVAQHVYEVQRAGQTRGMSEFASVIAAMKMGAEYTETALQAAILQASYAAVLQSQQNYKDALEVIDVTPPDTDGNVPSVADLALDNLEAASAYYDQMQLRFNGAKIPVLWPNEELKLLTPGQSATSLGEFQKQATKSYAAGTGTDPIQVSQDYSEVNYSSAKMSVATNYRNYESRRERLIAQAAMPMVAAVFEEAIFSGAFKLPKGISPADFFAARDALIRGTFLTQGAPNLDPVKEAQALAQEIGLGTATLMDAAAEKGLDYIDLLDQLARENQERLARGLPPAGVPAAMMIAPPAKDDGGGGGDKGGGKKKDAA